MESSRVFPLAPRARMALSTASDERLAELAAAHHAAYGELYSRYTKSVCSYFSWRCDHGSAEDLASETFLRSLKGIHRFDARRRWKTWLFGIARHVASEYARRKIHETAIDDGDHPLIDLSPSPLDEAIDAERTAVARALVANLSPTDQRLIVLRFWNGMSYREIGAVIGASEGAARVRIHRVLRKLRRQVGMMEENHS